MTYQASDRATNKSDNEEILALESRALARWCNGDPSGFLEITADDVVYFDPFLPSRMNGREALATYYEALRGKIFAERFELLAPVLQTVGDATVLTFNFVATTKDGREVRWHCTEVYRRQDIGFRIIQTHWSFAAPNPAPNSTG